MSLQGNWVDLLILMILLYFVIGVIRTHLWIVLADFFSFLFSLIGALRLYPYAAEFLKNNFSLSNSFSNALGFLVSAVVIEFVLSFIFSLLIKIIPNKFWKIPGRKLIAVIPALGEGLLFIAFILTLSLALPIAPKFKGDISDSKIGGYVVGKTSRFESRLTDIFGGVVEDTLTYLLVQPGSDETIPLNIEQKGLTVDEKAEKEMFALVNGERMKRGIKELLWSDALTEIGRAHAKDMWERKYFSHNSPEGEDVGDRLDKAGIKFQFAGENLALAPTVLIAHNGLMNSEGHRANILEAEFKKVGIGVIDNGIYGKMFVQVFTD